MLPNSPPMAALVMPSTPSVTARRQLHTPAPVHGRAGALSPATTNNDSAQLMK
ncbi:MAG TPA: hypothetical protein PKV17_03020 [Aquabacterium sp.]|nr:hypothetical protein [Aquabacterium sp.]